MNVPTITMDPEEARKKLQAYRRELHRKADEEYSAAAEGYEALANGKTLIDLDAAIRSGGFFEEMRPKLAVARADRASVYFEWRSTSDSANFVALAQGRRDRHNANTRRAESLNISVDLQQRHGQVDPKYPLWDKTIEGWALVPMVPADVRDQAPRDLSRLHILWEVDQWHDRLPNTAPVDPFLIEHLHGALWVVHAEWDLTELERSIMVGRSG